MCCEIAECGTCCSGCVFSRGVLKYVWKPVECWVRGFVSKYLTESLDNFSLICLQDLTNLSRLASLRTLGLKSSVYSACPVTLLCNYAIHLIYHLGQLTHLDDFEISGKYIKELTEASRHLVNSSGWILCHYFYIYFLIFSYLNLYLYGFWSWPFLVLLLL